MSSIDRNAAALVRFDLASGAAETLASDPTYDVHGVELHPITREVQIVSFERARVDHVVIDAAVADDVAAMVAAHPGDLVFASRDHSDRRWITAYNADDGPVSYCLFDRDTGESRSSSITSHDWRSTQLAEMEPFSFRTRDGLDVHGYLTFPLDGPRAARDGAERPRRPVGTRLLGLRPRPRSGSPIAATCASRSTSAARPDTARSS